MGSVLFFFLVVLGFELRATSLLSRYSSTSPTPLVLLARVILEIGTHFLPRQRRQFKGANLTELIKGT
jgi:hypothetical protein